MIIDKIKEKRERERRNRKKFIMIMMMMMIHSILYDKIRVGFEFKYKKRNIFKKILK